MSILRREVLRYIENNGGYVAVESGRASTIVMDEVLEIVADFGLSSRNSISVTISQLLTGRALERGGEEAITRRAARYKEHQYLGITDVGRRELKWRLGDPLLDEVDNEVAKYEPDTLETDDPIERLHARERELHANDQTDEVDTVGEPDVEVAAVTEARTEPDQEPKPEPPPTTGMDYQALAAELLRQVLAATRSDDQWVAEVERLENELKTAQQAVEQVREDSAQMVIRLNAKIEDNDRARSKLVQELNTARREREEAVAQHARANEQVGLLRTQLRRALKERDERPQQTAEERAQQLRTYGLDDENKRKLNEIAQMMREGRGPQVDG